MIRVQKTQAIEQALSLPSYNCVTTTPNLQHVNYWEITPDNLSKAG